MYIVTLNKSVAVFQGIVLALLITAVVAEFTTEEDVSKQIVVPTLFVAIISEIAGVFAFSQTIRNIKLR